MTTVSGSTYPTWKVTWTHSEYGVDVVQLLYVNRADDLQGHGSRGVKTPLWNSARHFDGIAVEQDDRHIRLCVDDQQMTYRVRLERLLHLRQAGYEPLDEPGEMLHFFGMRPLQARY